MKRLQTVRLLIIFAACYVSTTGNGPPSAIGAEAKPLVPGTGQRIVQVGDDFEDPKWQFIPQPPKSSREMDEQLRAPNGIAANRRWYEGVMRGYPDIVKIVPTPADGPAGKTSLLMQTRYSGIPGQLTYRTQQDDFVADCDNRLRGSIPVWQNPSVVVRVFLPEFDKWEERSGPSFGFRTAVDTRAWKDGMHQRETYWPGIFLEFLPKNGRGRTADGAVLRIRANRWGADLPGPEVTQTGWWTMGMSFTADGQVHYFAKPGLGDLAEEHCIASHYPYGYKCERFKTFFFNVCNRDDGQTWSTPWIVDDCYAYYVPAERQTQRGATTGAR